MEAFSLVSAPDGLDAQTALRLKKRAAEEFRSQLVLGAPNNTDEAGLRRLSAQLKSKKLVVKLFLRYRLHAKVYLIHRVDPNRQSGLDGLRCYPIPVINANEDTIATKNSQHRKNAQSSLVGRCARDTSDFARRTRIKSTVIKMVEATNQNCNV
jgi:hypothetical protein